MNYLRSELYRIARTKAIYTTAIVWLGLFSFCSYSIVGKLGSAAINWEYFIVFFVIALLSSLFLTAIVNNILVGNSLAVLKQSLSFGSSRTVMYFVKLILTFLVVILILILAWLVFWGIGAYVLGDIPTMDINFIVKILSALPLLVSCTALCNWLNFAKVNPALSILFVFVFYAMSGDLIQIFDRLIFRKDVLTNYMPSALLIRLTTSNQFEATVVYVGLGLSVLFLFLGMRTFRRMDVA